MDKNYFTALLNGETQGHKVTDYQPKTYGVNTNGTLDGKCMENASPEIYAAAKEFDFDSKKSYREFTELVEENGTNVEKVLLRIQRRKLMFYHDPEPVPGSRVGLRGVKFMGGAPIYHTSGDYMEATNTKWNDKYGTRVEKKNPEDLIFEFCKEILDNI